MDYYEKSCGVGIKTILTVDCEYIPPVDRKAAFAAADAARAAAAELDTNNRRSAYSL